MERILDELTATVLILVVLALVAVAFFAAFRRRAKVLIQSGDNRLELDGSNDPPATTPGVEASQLKAGGDIEGLDQSGRGVKVDDAQAKGSIRLENRSPGDPDPNP